MHTPRCARVCRVSGGRAPANHLPVGPIQARGLFLTGGGLVCLGGWPRGSASGPEGPHEGLAWGNTARHVGPRTWHLQGGRVPHR